MHREYHKWFSPRLGRDMELLVFGHSGTRVLAFPTRLGRFFEYEDRGFIEALRDNLESGAIQLICVDSVDVESFYCEWKIPKDRIGRHMQYESYILQEVLPFSKYLNRNPHVTSFGCSLGAFHAMNIALRHPGIFKRVIAFSGRYDLTLACQDFHNLLHGYYDSDVYFNTPSHFMPGMTDELLLTQIRKLNITLVVGDEDPFYDNTKVLSDTFWSKGIAHSLHRWTGRAHRFRYWRQMARIYF